MKDLLGMLGVTFGLGCLLLGGLLTYMEPGINSYSLLGVGGLTGILCVTTARRAAPHEPSKPPRWGRTLAAVLLGIVTTVSLLVAGVFFLFNRNRFPLEPITQFCLALSLLTSFLLYRVLRA